MDKVMIQILYGSAVTQIVLGGLTIHRAPEKKQATLIFAITSPSVEIFLQFLKHFVPE